MSAPSHSREPIKWVPAMRIIIAELENGTPEGKALARAELMDLAKRLDRIAGEVDKG